MISILRDALVPIEGHGWNRINAAYSFDGVGLAVNTVNQVFDLDIQRFVVIDFNGVKDFVNKVGGVDIKLTQAEADYYNRTNLMYTKVSAGKCHMNGHMALTYMRTRKLDSDFGRTSRQRTLIEALANKILNEKNAAELYDLTDTHSGLLKRIYRSQSFRVRFSPFRAARIKSKSNRRTCRMTMRLRINIIMVWLLFRLIRIRPPHE